jgi:transcriptional regulator with XRE-family HTH domain
MTTKKDNLKDYKLARKRMDLSAGDSVRIMRELNELSQPQLAEITGIAVNSLAAIEKNQLALGIEHAAILAAALHVDPVVLLSSEDQSKSAA